MPKDYNTYSEDKKKLKWQIVISRYQNYKRFVIERDSMSCMPYYKYLTLQVILMSFEVEDIHYEIESIIGKNKLNLVA